MKKLIAIFIAVMLMASLATGVALAIKPGTDFSGPHYNLNIIGKKSDWSGGGSYDNWNRHTMFVPANTDDCGCYSPPDDATRSDESGITIWMSQDKQATDFKVLDGVAGFDADGDGDVEGEECSAHLELPAGQYNVYVVAKAKTKDGQYTDITGWVRYTDDNGVTWYYMDVGYIQVKGKQWKDATDLFYVSPGEDPFGAIGDDMWVFDYMDLLEDCATGQCMDDTAYFWQFDNHGNKLVKLRFYPK